VARTSRLDPRAPSALPPAGELRVVDRARVAAEVLANYGPLWRAVRTNDLVGMAATARTSPRLVQAPPEQHAELAYRLGGIVQGVMRVLPTDKRCLITSLVTLRVMANRSIDGRLVIGVRSGDEFEAHAWVEHDERPVLPVNGFHRLHEL
jgi:hypothetical protein